MKKLTINDVTSGISTAAAERADKKTVKSGLIAYQDSDAAKLSIEKAEEEQKHERRSAAAKKAAATRAKNRAAKKAAAEAAEKVAESSKKTVTRANDKQAAAAVQIAAERNAELAKAAVKDGAKKNVRGVSGKSSAKSNRKSERKTTAEKDAEKASAAKKAAETAKESDAAAEQKRIDNKIDTEMCVTVKNAKFVRPGMLETFTDCVRYDIAKTILHEREKAISGPRAAIEKNHAGVSFLNMSKDNLLKYALELTHKVNGRRVKYTEADAEMLVNKRAAYKSAKINIENQTITADYFSSLCPTDRFFVDIVAIRNYNGVSLDRSVIYSGDFDEKGRPVVIDFMPAVKASYTSAGVGELADKVRVLINKAAGAPGVLCYGISTTVGKLKQSQDGVNLEHLKAALHAGAKLDDSGKYIYFLKDSIAVFVREFTRFCSVIIDDNAYKLIKTTKKRAAEKRAA